MGNDIKQEQQISPRDEQIEQLLEVVRDIQVSQEKTHEALAESLNVLTKRMDELEKVHTKIMGRDVFYNAVMETEGVSNDVKLSLIKKIVNYTNKEEE
jgi:hypothetical protein